MREVIFMDILLISIKSTIVKKYDRESLIVTFFPTLSLEPMLLNNKGLLEDLPRNPSVASLFVCVVNPTVASLI